MRINTNLAALNSWRNLTANSNNLQKSLEKLSSGFRVNRAADDAAGLAVSEKMRAQIRGTNQAVRNSQDGISLLQTAEGALTETHNMLQRMRELAVQGSTDTLQDADRVLLQEEFAQLQLEITRIGNATQFNGRNLLDGSSAVEATATSSLISSITGNGDTQATVGHSLGTLVKATNALASVDFGVATTDAATTLTLNGKEFAWDSGTTLTTIAADLNNVSSETGVSVAVTGNVLEMTSTAVGSDATITATGSGGNVATSIADTFNDALAAGTSTGVTSTGADAQLSGFTADYTADGDDVTITSGVLKGLAFTVDTAGAESVTVTANGTLSVQTGSQAGQSLNMSIGDMRATALGVDSISIATQSGSSSSITTVDSAINTVSTQRSKLGAFQNRLEYTVSSLSATAENLAAAESRIRDVDMASEMANFTKYQILGQASTAMLAQANQVTQGVLSLLR